MANRLSNRHVRKATMASSTITPRTAPLQGAQLNSTTTPTTWGHRHAPLAIADSAPMWFQDPARCMPRGSATKWAQTQGSAPASDFVVWLISYGRAHTGVFMDLASNLIASLRKLGYTAELAQGSVPPRRRGQLIVFGANILHQPEQIPPGSIIYQLEQVCATRWMNDTYIRILRSHIVWDFSAYNVSVLKNRFNVRAHLCRIGGRVESTPPSKCTKDIDVLFYGSRNERRDVIIRQLKSRGIKVHDTGAWGDQLTQVIARSKVVLNVHYYPDAVLEIVRVSHAIESGANVVTEVGKDPDLERRLGDGITVVPYGKIVNAVKKQLAKTQDERDATVAKGMAALSAMPYSGELDSAIRGSLPTMQPQSERPVAPVRQMKCYINNYNRLTWTKAIAVEILRLGGEPIIIDNSSTYPPLLEWYKDCPYRVERLPKNMGSRAPWLSGVLDRELQKGERYVVTDPDLDLSKVPSDALDMLARGFRYGVFKSGLSLEINDVPAKLRGVMQVNGRTLEQIERAYWKDRLDSQFWRAPVDTTFAMYRYAGKVTTFGRDFVRGVRSDRPYTAKHLPWYRTAAEFDAEDLYYAEHRHGTPVEGRMHRNGSWYDAVRKAGATP
jgi:hypothetical protein